MTTVQGSAPRSSLTPSLNGLSFLLDIACVPFCLKSLCKLFPFGMNETCFGPVGPLVSMRAEKVSLRLRQVQRQVRRAIRVEISEARTHRRRRYAKRLRGRHGLPPPWLRLK